MKIEFRTAGFELRIEKELMPKDGLEILLNHAVKALAIVLMIVALMPIGR